MCRSEKCNVHCAAMVRGLYHTLTGRNNETRSERTYVNMYNTLCKTYCVHRSATVSVKVNARVHSGDNITIAD